MVHHCAFCDEDSKWRNKLLEKRTGKKNSNSFFIRCNLCAFMRKPKIRFASHGFRIMEMQCVVRVMLEARADLIYLLGSCWFGPCARSLARRLIDISIVDISVSVECLKFFFFLFFLLHTRTHTNKIGSFDSKKTKQKYTEKKKQTTNNRFVLKTASAWFCGILICVVALHFQTMRMCNQILGAEMKPHAVSQWRKPQTDLLKWNWKWHLDLFYVFFFDFGSCWRK